MFKKLFLLLLLVVPLSGCSYDSIHENKMMIENHFTLVGDTFNWFPHQPDYFDFLKSGYIDTYCYPDENGYTVHYFMEYLKEGVVEDYGTYDFEDGMLHLSLNTLGNKYLTFNHSQYTTVDYLLVGTITYEKFYYYLVYEARYQITAKG